MSTHNEHQPIVQVIEVDENNNNEIHCIELKETTQYYAEEAFAGPVEGSGGGGGGCFPAGQKVFTSNGWKPIEKLIPGELVVTFDKYGTLEHGKIERVHRHSKQENNSGIFTFKFVDSKNQSLLLQVTGNHAIFCGENSETHFKQAQEFVVGDCFFHTDGTQCEIVEITQRDIDETEYTYNLTVVPQHTYIVENVRVHNGGGGKSSGGAPRPAQESPNTLRSTNIARVVEVLSEGPVEGLASNTLRDVYFNDTPVQNVSNGWNFSVQQFDFRAGLPSQTYAKGFNSASNVVSINTVLTNPAPVVHTVAADIDACIVQIRLPNGLYSQNTTNGDVTGNSVQLAVDVKLTSSGTWTQLLIPKINGKTMSAYDVSWRIQRPTSYDNQQWDVRIRRSSIDSTTASSVNNTMVFQITEINEVKLTYPNVAYAAIALNAESVGNSIPNRSYDLKGIKCKIPSNYNPITRAYSGVWNGTFNTAWTDNPAWIVYDLLTSTRYGMGEFIDDASIDKWSFYTASQYNDQLVDDGNGGTEPRFTFNSVIQTREDCWKLIQAIASSMRAVVVPGGVITLVQDRPTSPVKIVTNSNVKDGMFTYTGSGYLTRQTAVNVTYNDKYDRYLPKICTVEDSAGIARYGYNVADLVAYGAVTEGQAQRAGKWFLDTQLNQTEAVSYQVGFNQADVVPGDVVYIMDNDYTTLNYSGRIVSATNSTVTLDQQVTLDPNTTYTFTYLTYNAETIATSTFTTGVGYTSNTITINALEPIVQPSAVVGYDWMLTSTSIVNARQFKVVSMKEQEKGVFAVNAVYHDPSKYTRVETGINIPAPVFSAVGMYECEPPSSIYAFLQTKNDTVLTATVDLWVYWQPSPSPNIAHYVVMWSRNNGPIQTRVANTHFTSFRNSEEGTYTFSVFAVNGKGVASSSIETELTVNYDNPSDLQPPTNLRMQPGYGTGTQWYGKELVVTWDAPDNTQIFDETPHSKFPIQIDVYATSGMTLLRTAKIGTGITKYTYSSTENDSDGGPRDSITMIIYSLNQYEEKSSTATSVSFTAAATPVPDSLITTTAVGGIGLTWDNKQPNPNNSVAATEVWGATTNNRAAATKLATVVGNTFTHSVDSGQTWYYWVRIVSIYGATSAYHPTSSTGGVMALAPYVITSDLVQGAVSDTTFIEYAGTVIGTGAEAFANETSLVSLDFTGDGSTTIIDYSATTAMTSSTSQTFYSPNAYGMYIAQIEDLDAGGADSNTGWLSWNNYTYADRGTAGFDWTNINNAKTEDGTYATMVPPANPDRLFLYNFGIDQVVPANATVTGLIVKFKGVSTGASEYTYMELDWSGANFPTNWGSNISLEYTPTLWTTERTQYIGNPYSLNTMDVGWGGYYTWNGSSYVLTRDINTADIRNPNMGVYIRFVNSSVATLYSIDAVQVKVFYTTKTIIRKNINAFRSLETFATNDRISIDQPIAGTTGLETVEGKNYRFTLKTAVGLFRNTNTATVRYSNRNVKVSKLKR